MMISVVPMCDTHILTVVQQLIFCDCRQTDCANPDDDVVGVCAVDSRPNFQKTVEQPFSLIQSAVVVVQNTCSPVLLFTVLPPPAVVVVVVRHSFPIGEKGGSIDQ